MADSTRMDLARICATEPYVVAPTYQMGRDWCRRQGIPLNLLIVTPEHILGLRGVRIMVLNRHLLSFPMLKELHRARLCGNIMMEATT